MAERPPDIAKLVSATEAAARAMGLEPPEPGVVRSQVEELLFKSQADGGKEIWGVSTAGLITEIETRGLLMANLATWIARMNDAAEPSAERWSTPELEEAFEHALFGRLANISPGTDSSYSFERIVEAWCSLPKDIRYAPASEDDLAAFEATHGPIPAQYRWFLSACGGGAVGSEWIDGIEQLPETHRKFAEESALAAGWKMCDVFVIGWDGSGNPIAIELKPADGQLFVGRVVVEDHQFGGIHSLAPSFLSFVARALGVRP